MACRRHSPWRTQKAGRTSLRRCRRCSSPRPLSFHVAFCSWRLQRADSDATATNAPRQYHDFPCGAKPHLETYETRFFSYVSRPHPQPSSQRAARSLERDCARPRHCGGECDHACLLLLLAPTRPPPSSSTSVSSGRRRQARRAARPPVGSGPTQSSTTQTRRYR